MKPPFFFRVFSQVFARVFARSPQRGFLIPTVLIILAILFILAMTRQFFSRQRLQMADHMRDYELSYQMAASGMLVGTRLFNQALDFINDSSPSTFPKHENAPAAIKPIITGLLDEQGLPFPQGATLVLDNNFVNRYLQEVRDAKGVQITMEMRRKEALFSAGTDPGFQPDEREVSYDFFINTEGRFGGSSVRITTFFEGRFVNILPPVLGKFSLFVREQPLGGVNQFIDSSAVTLLKNAPITIRSGEVAEPNSLTPAQVTPFLENQGWVFLGGIAPWRLNMSKGGGNQYLTECFLRTGFFLFPIPADQELGKVGGISYCAKASPLFKELREDEGYQVLLLKKPAEDNVQTSILHLFGSKKNPSPTLVFGNVIRRWLLKQGVKKDSDPRQFVFPYLDQTSFSASNWPGDRGVAAAVTLIKKNFSHSFDAYAKKMSDVFEEEINASNLYALNLDDTVASTSPILAVPALPPSFSGCRLSKRMQVDNSPAGFFKMNAGSVYELKNTEGKALFSGGDLGRIEDLSFLEKKAGMLFAGEQEFWKKIPRGPGNSIKLAGVVLIRGDLTIAEPLLIGPNGGGMILCTGNVWVKASIQGPSAEPLSIISLSKNVNVETTSQVHAALIAVKGQVRLPKEIIINGLVAAKSLEIPVGSPDRKREINYQVKFDPSDAENYRRGYRMMASQKRYSFVH
jgi:Tfp pilus assembly protein PilX